MCFGSPRQCQQADRDTSVLACDERDDIVYVDDFLTADEEEEIARRLRSFDLHPVRMHGVETRRRIGSFGLDYRPGTRSLDAAMAIPDFLLEIRDRAARHAAHSSESLAQALVTLYPAGSQIGWHIDHPSFGDTVVAVSLLGRAVLELRREKKGPTLFKRELAPQSLYVMPPALRYGYLHRVIAREERFSITFPEHQADCG